MAVFGFGRRDAAVAVQEPAMVEPVDPFQGCEFEVVEALQRSSVAHEFGLVEPDDRFGQRVVVAVAAGADRGDDVVGGEPFGVADG